MNNPEKTKSERLFEQFCDENQVPWDRIPATNVSSQKTPDYKIECAGNTIIVEVKEFGLSPDDRIQLDQLQKIGSAGGIDCDPKLDERVRKKISHAMPQLRRLAKNKYPAIIVLYDELALLRIGSLEIRLAMYGQDIVDIGLTKNQNLIYRHRFGGGRKVTEKDNTTLSAVALLYVQADGVKHLDFHHNKFAAIPFNPSWLDKSVVTHFRLGNNLQEGGLRGWESISSD